MSTDVSGESGLLLDLPFEPDMLHRKVCELRNASRELVRSERSGQQINLQHTGDADCTALNEGGWLCGRRLG
jgi:hypothetical protein